MREPANRQSANACTLPDKIRQMLLRGAMTDERLHAVSLLLNHFRPESTLAFCNTKQQCRELLAVLQAQGFDALALYGELEQRERDQVLVQFANRSCSVLVATDVAARGLDISQLQCRDQCGCDARCGTAHPPHWPHRSRRCRKAWP
jgi:superfamily II DNA/RNA helicase